MATFFQCLWGFFQLLSLHFIHSSSTTQVYIVYLGNNRLHDPLLTSESHVQLLSKVFASENDARRSMLYSYKQSFSGFSAKLNSTQAATLASKSDGTVIKMEGVIALFRSRVLQLHTTRSWDFMGLTLDYCPGMTSLQLAYGGDVVVGMFDTGIWPESESFQEDPCTDPIPSYWKGQCIQGEMFEPVTACNCKLIGARYYRKGFEHTFKTLNSDSSEYQSARDFHGHGTHAASTAAGSIVQNASFFGLGRGIARGGAPRARLAVYKVCWNDDLRGSCAEADIFAAFDDALHDGVRVISASFGATPPLPPYFESAADIGAFHAMQLGVSVVFSAGNNGPDPSLVSNVAPWAISVAASSMDRTFPTHISVDNAISIVGQSLITQALRATLEDASDYFSDGICNLDNWGGQVAPRDIVLLCVSTDGFVSSSTAQEAVQKANGVGLIFAEVMTSQIARVGRIPTVEIDISQGTIIRNYIAQSPTLPVVQIAPSTTAIGKSPAPVVAYFSSRGPSSLSRDILKPDVSAPGVNVLAAWPPDTSVMPSDQRSAAWNFQSGTSMSCPHVSGAVALLKSAHPDWSPAAIRSALMTTAYNRDTTKDRILAGGCMKGSDPFDIGSGHINPSKAIDPGLIYDMKSSDYIALLCNIGYTEQQIQNIVLLPPGTTRPSCPKAKWDTTNADMNYPSITVSNLQSTTTIRRTVRNVGQTKTALYFVSVKSPSGVEIVVWPRLLVFTCFREETSYYVTLKPQKKSRGRYYFGHITWSDGFHHVRSPLVVFLNNTS